jgi:hypothetical protein
MQVGTSLGRGTVEYREHYTLVQVHGCSMTLKLLLFSRGFAGNWHEAAVRSSFNLKSLSLGSLKTDFGAPKEPDDDTGDVELSFDGPFTTTSFRGDGQGDAEADFPQSRRVSTDIREINLPVGNEDLADRLVKAFTRAGELCGAKRDLFK